MSNQSLSTAGRTNSAKTAAQEAWQQAIKQYEQDFGPKQVRKIMESKGPRDVITTVLARQQKEKTQTYYRYLEGNRNFFARFERYQSALDITFQGTKRPWMPYLGVHQSGLDGKRFHPNHMLVWLVAYESSVIDRSRTCRDLRQAIECTSVHGRMPPRH